MKKRRGIIILVIIVICAALAVFFFFRRHTGAGKGADAAYVESVAELSGAQNAGVLNRYSGVVESQETWDISLNADQTVKEIFVSVGDDVTVGTPLFEYDTTDIGLQLAQAKLELEEIGNEITGYNSQIKTLNAEKKTVSKDEQFGYTVQIQSLETQIKQAEYNQESKKMEIEKLQNTLSQSVVESKIDGVVKTLNENGDTTDAQGNPVPFLSILTTGDYRVRGTVNETNVWMLEEGAPVILRSRIDPEQIWYGTIEKIDTENQETSENSMYGGDSGQDMQSSKYPFYISLSSSDGLMLGQHLYIELDEGQESAMDGIWLYSSYIVQEEDTPFVWADNGSGKLEKREVELGEYQENLDMYQILSGLDESDRIAWDQPGLSEGMPTTENMEESILMNEEMTDEFDFSAETESYDMEGSGDNAEEEFVSEESDLTGEDAP